MEKQPREGSHGGNSTRDCFPSGAMQETLIPAEQTCDNTSNVVSTKGAL